MAKNQIKKKNLKKKKKLSALNLKKEESCIFAFNSFNITSKRGVYFSLSFSFIVCL